MRARRGGYEPAGAGFAVARVSQRRDRASRDPRQNQLATLASVTLHAAALALLLLLTPGAPPGEEETAPSFAVQFDTGAPQSAATPPTPPSEPRVSLGGSDMPPPPEPDESAEPVPRPIPRPRYGSALRPRANSNPFANVVPFDLGPRQPRSLSAGAPGSHSLDLAAGPSIRQGRLMDPVQHVIGSHGAGDYAEVLRAYVEAHRDYIQYALRGAEEGQAVLQVTITRDGSVKSLHLIRPSGSQLLDAAWMAFFRDHKLPPMNDDIPGEEYTFDYELDYSIIYGPPPR